MLDSVRQMFGARKLSADDAYRTLVKETAAGKNPPDNCVDICVAAGRSVADLEADVETKMKLNQAEADLKRADTMQSEIDRLSQEQHEAFQAHEELVKRHRKELEESHSTVAHATSAYTGASHRQQNLRWNARQLLNNTVDPTAG